MKTILLREMNWVEIYRRGRRVLPTVWLLMVAVGLLACTTTGPPGSIDFSQFVDRPLPPSTIAWLKSGPQSRITPAVETAAASISGQNRRERLYHIVDHVWQQFAYDAWFSDQNFSKTADELFARKVLGGCSDYALVQATLFRASGIPSRMVVTANVDWMLRFQKNDLLLPVGHVFIEVYLEDRWYLVDATNRTLYDQYDPNANHYPRGEIRCWRGRDYWQGGLDSVDAVSRLLKAEAAAYGAGDYEKPNYPQFELRLPRNI